MTAIRPLLLSAADVAAVAPSHTEILAILTATYRAEAEGKVQVPAKFGVHPDRPGGFWHAMPARVPEAAGMKWVSYFPGNLAGGLPDSTALVVLNDAETGLPVSILEGMWVTQARSAGGVAIAARHLARGAPRRLGLVGCGPINAWSLRMLAAEFPSLAEVFVASRRAETRRAFCAEMAAEGPWRLTPVDDVRGAVEGMDIVVTALPKAVTPPIEASWWSPGTLIVPLDVVSSLDDAAFAAADRMVSDGEAQLRNAVARWRPTVSLEGKTLERLQDLVAGKAAARGGAGGRCVAFVTGISSHDIALAWAIYERARRAGLGTRFAFT